MRNIEDQNYRHELAKSLSETPKQERKERLNQSRKTEQYWHSRNKKIEGNQNEKPINDGLGIFVKTRALYHGSATAGIKEFTKADEATVGEGLYLTSKAENAIAYARERADQDRTRVIYETQIHNLRLLELRNEENQRKILEGFKEVLKEELQKNLDDPDYIKISPEIDPLIKPFLREIEIEKLREAISDIENNNIRPGNLRRAVFYFKMLFSNYVQSLGYDGLVTIEGGEGQVNQDHDTYLIFDPKKVNIAQEEEIL